MLLGNSQVNVGLRIFLKDEFSGPATQLKNNLKQLREETRLYQDSLRSARNMYGGLAAAGTAGLIGLSQAYQTGAKFDFVMRGVAAASGATADEFKRMMDYANQAGSTGLYMPKEIGTSMRELALAGLDAKEVMASIAPVMQLAGGAMEDLKLGAEIATNAMYMFGYDKSKIKDWQYVADILAQGSVKSQIGLRDLGESIKYAGATAKDLGQTLPDLTAMVMVLGNAGIKGSMAGTAVENMFRYMALGLGQYAKTGRAAVWEKIGLDPKSMVDVQGNLKPMPEIMGNLYTVLSKYGDVDRQNILYEIFGVRGKRGASKLLMDGLKEYKKHIGELKNSEGVAGQMYGRMLDSPEGAIIKLKGAFQALMNQFTQTMAPLVTPLLEILTYILKGIKWLTSSTLGSWLTRIGVLLLVFKTTVWGIKFALAATSLALNTTSASFMTMATSIKIATANLAQFMGVSGGAQVMQAKNGALYVLQGGGLGARFVSRSAAKGAGTAAMSRAGMAGGIGALGKKALMSGTARMAGGLGVGLGAYDMITGTTTADKIGGGMSAVGGGLLAFSPEPVTKAIGAGLMLVGMVMPSLVNSMNRNTDATNANTDATQEQADLNRRQLSFIANQGNPEGSTYIRRLFRNGVGKDANLDYLLEQQKQMYLQNPKLWGGKPFYDYSNPHQLIIYIDGKISKDLITREQNKTINKTIQFE